MNNKKLNLINQKFGELTVIKELKERKQRAIQWECICSCGNKITAQGRVLKAGRKTHCGCKTKRGSYKREPKISIPITSHRYYTKWMSIKARCYNPNYEKYKYYGARGICIDKEWINNAKKFCIWLDKNLGDCPETYSLDRIDNNGNYEPGNLRWASPKKQLENRRPPTEWN